MPSLGPTELIIVLVLALIVVGPGKLPSIGSSLGRSIREFRQGLREATGAESEPSGAEAAPGEKGEAQ